jgi:hypothetical protein
MAHQVNKRSRTSSTGAPESAGIAAQETLAEDVKDRLRHAQIVRLEGDVTELECTEMQVKTEGSQYGVNRGTMHSFRFRVNGISVVLYTAAGAIPYYREVELPLAEGDHVRLAIASEGLSDQRLVYGLRHPADPRAFVAFSAGSLEFTPDRQLNYLPRLPRFWARSRWKQASRFVVAGVLVFSLFAYLAHGDSSENGRSTSVVMNSLAAIALGSYFLFIGYGALRWRCNLPTARQRNLLAVLSALETPARGPGKGVICAV